MVQITVGQLIKQLQEFDPTWVIVADININGYADIQKVCGAYGFDEGEVGINLIENKY